jgi:hypothetical protein
MQFDPDYQLFAPLHLDDVDELSARQRSNVGWYGSWNRMFVGLTRSDTEPENTRIDTTWGNQFTFGFMTDNDHGWHFGVSHMSGPNVYDDLFQNRLNLIENSDLNDPLNPLRPSSFRNDPIFLERAFLIRNSLNVAEHSHFEVNKTWRLEPYRYGGILEPMIGLRHGSFTDYAQNDTYTVFTVPDSGGGGLLDAESLVRDIVTTKNSMLLGQIGWHYTKYSQRWTLTNDTRFFAGQNFQTQHTGLYNFTTVYSRPPAVGTPPIVDGLLPNVPDNTAGTTFSGRNNSEFVVGMDIKSEAAYQLGKAFSLRVGAQLTYYGRGIWRGSTSTEGGNQFLQQQDVLMPGLTFGFAFNR